MKKFILFYTVLLTLAVFPQYSDVNLERLARENVEAEYGRPSSDYYDSNLQPKTRTDSSVSWMESVKGPAPVNDLLFGTGLAEEVEKPSLSREVNIYQRDNYLPQQQNTSDNFVKIFKDNLVLFIVGILAFIWIINTFFTFEK